MFSIFDLVALFVEVGVTPDCDLPIGFRGNACGDAALCESGAEPIDVLTLAQGPFGFRHRRQQSLPRPCSRLSAPRLRA
jgi:hypothetical protein